MRHAPVPLRWPTPEVGLLLVVAAACWLWTVGRSHGLHAMPGAMGLALPAFAMMWLLMATAMMLPSAAPVASLYARSVRRNRPIRLGGFAAGYLLVWAASAVPAYGLARLADRAVAAAPAVGTVTAAVVFAANGAYQLSGLKDRCLSRCRSPFALLLRSATWRGPFRDLRAGAHSGGSCLGDRPGGRSTYGVCDFALSWSVTRGWAAGGVDLSGLEVVMAGSYDDDERGSPWRVALYVDDRADEAQHRALAAIFLGRAGGDTFTNFASGIGEVYAVRPARVRVDHTPDRQRIHVDDHVTVRTLRPVVHDEPVSCGIPGHDRPGQELRADLFRVHDEPLVWEVTGRCAFATDFTYRSGRS